MTHYPYLPRPLAALVAVLMLLVSSLNAHAFGGRRDVRTRLQQAADDALGKAKASPAQRAQLRPTIDEILRTAEDAFGSEPGTIPESEELLRLFAAERLDARALAHVRARRDRRHKQLADALVKAVHDFHAALSPEQRGRLADYTRGKSAIKSGRAIKEKIITTLVRSQIDDLLGQLPATDGERQTVNGLRERLTSFLFTARTERAGRVEELTNVFRADTLDQAAIDRIRTTEEGRIGELTALLEKCFTELHAAMSPPHRVRLVELIRDMQAHRPHSTSASSGEPF